MGETRIMTAQRTLGQSAGESINQLIKKLSEDIQKDIESGDLRVKGQVAEKTRALAELIVSSTRVIN